MKKITLQIVTAILLLSNISCSDEKDLEINEQIQETVFELPKNAISLDEYINKLEEQLNVQTKQRTALGNLENLNHVSGFQKVFVIFSSDWTPFDKFDFYDRMRGKSTNQMFILSNACENIDTLFIPVEKTVPGRDKNKNIIVASTTVILDDENEEEEDDEDGPKEEKVFYNSCEEIVL
ncbi:hypothetical protein [uncultured Tenacibaculum sp.]|uniref:hypothetical protein n=1 Tax=uncultured Tenacibaculum sp. TaxID=174713 RepID=UPI0026338019|nr:hypothetical protein [uncultured Tenacibaculum sp.]